MPFQMNFKFTGQVTSAFDSEREKENKTDRFFFKYKEFTTQDHFFTLKIS